MEEDMEDKGGLAPAIHMCPHLEESVCSSALNRSSYPRLNEETARTCSVKGCNHKECWLCLGCMQVYCGRYGNKHMLQHVTDFPTHCVAVGINDLSYWCYECNSYIDHLSVEKVFELYKVAHIVKFGEAIPAGMEHETRFVDPKKGEVYDCKEYFDSEMDLREKAKLVAKYIMESKYTVALTGAGISTSAKIPDYRGPKGAWTLRSKGQLVNMEIELEDAQPTYAHKALYSMLKNDLLSHVITTNVDGLHRKSGFVGETLSELHGCVYNEYCTVCKQEYFRTFDVTKSLVGASRFTGRQCERNGCLGYLRDSTVAFGESLPKGELDKAVRASKLANLFIVIGSSMRVSPSCDLPSWCKSRGGVFVLINLQKTPYDEEATVRVFGRSDDFMRLVCSELFILSSGSSSEL